MRLAGASATPPVLEGLEPLPGHSHYFTGNDLHRWHIGTPPAIFNWGSDC